MNDTVKVPVCTAVFQYQGEHRFDATRRGNSPFSPSWALIQDALEVTQGRDAACLPTERFRARYLTELRRLWLDKRELWVSLASKAREQGGIVLVCYCKAFATCARTVFADALTKAGPSLGVPFARGRELRPRAVGHATVAGKQGGRKHVPFVLWESPTLDSPQSNPDVLPGVR